jgi:hypothetical protein
MAVRQGATEHLEHMLSCNESSRALRSDLLEQR